MTVPVPPLDESTYRVAGESSIPTPSVAVYPDIVARNIDQAISWAGGDSQRLRPHAKTHKTVEIVEMMLNRGITKHKCATLAEAEMLIRAGVSDILVAYPMLGPNTGRFVELLWQHPGVRFACLVDHPAGVESLAKACKASHATVDVLVDLDGGLGRTGIAMGRDAVELYRSIERTGFLRAGGVQLYDGNVVEPDLEKRREIVRDLFARLTSFVEDVEACKMRVPQIVVAGTGTAPVWLDVASSEPRLQASPGTFVYSDWNYHCRFPDGGIVPAAIALTRIISKPKAGRLTCDLGHKAVAADPPAAKRVHFLSLREFEFVLQSEEHLVIDTPEADRYQPGDLLYAIPYHICPTCALHRDMLVVRDHRVVGRWRVASRDRELTPTA